MAASGSVPPPKLQISLKLSSAPAAQQQQSLPSPACDHPAAQRRTGGSGSFGSGGLSRQSAAPKTPQRRTHKSSKRFRIEDDAIAEAARPLLPASAPNADRSQAAMRHSN